MVENSQALHRDGPLNTFVSYAEDDRVLFLEFEKHLSLLVRQERIQLWTKEDIDPGDLHPSKRLLLLESADVIVLLVSSSYIHSHFEEASFALRKQDEGRSRVIAVHLRPCDLSGAPFSDRVFLPRSGLAITSHPNLDEAWLDVVRGIGSCFHAKGKFSSSEDLFAANF